MIKIIIPIVVVALAAASYFALYEGMPLIEKAMATDVGRLVDQPNEFDGRRVTIRGVVVDRAAIMGVGGYRLKQGNAEIFVVSGRGIPPPGAEITVSGTFKQAFAIGGFQYAVLVEK